MSGARPEFVAQEGPGSWRLEVWAQPGGSMDAVAGTHQGRLKIKVRAKAVDNKANEALEAYLAKMLGLKTRQVRIASGLANRRKTFLVLSEVEPDWNGVVLAGTTWQHSNPRSQDHGTKRSGPN